jgi:hypothetical protein
MKMQDTLLTADERRRNTHGPHLLFEYTEKSQGTYNSPLVGHFPNIIDHHAQYVVCKWIVLDLGGPRTLTHVYFV